MAVRRRRHRKRGGFGGFTGIFHRRPLRADDAVELPEMEHRRDRDLLYARGSKDGAAGVLWTCEWTCESGHRFGARVPGSPGN